MAHTTWPIHSKKNPAGECLRSITNLERCSNGPSEFDSMAHPIKSPRKLIEVALPLDAINAACAYEKMPGIGPHPRGIHLWWARRPLAAARAVIFAQLVNDPAYCRMAGSNTGRTRKTPPRERKRLFTIIEDLVKWENTHK